MQLQRHADHTGHGQKYPAEHMYFRRTRGTSITSAREHVTEHEIEPPISIGDMECKEVHILSTKMNEF